jgi:hypoxanthine phosphoribosyltransferase
MRDLQDDIAYVLINEEELDDRIIELARAVEADLGEEANLLLVCVLKGGFMFLADFSRALNVPHAIDFMAVSSYGHSTKSSGVVRINLDLKQDIEKYDVLIVEDIIDSGLTLDYLRRLLLERNPRSLQVCALLRKPLRHLVDVPVEYVGFEVPDEFVVGYGLDYGELYRNLPYVAVLKPEVFS